MSKYKMEPLPDEVVAKDGTVFNPNAPLTDHEEVPDRRPQILYTDFIYTEAYWTGRLNAKVNGKPPIPPKPHNDLDNRPPTC